MLIGSITFIFFYLSRGIVNSNADNFFVGISLWIHFFRFDASIVLVFVRSDPSLSHDTFWVHFPVSIQSSVGNRSFRSSPLPLFFLSSRCWHLQWVLKNEHFFLPRKGTKFFVSAKIERVWDIIFKDRWIFPYSFGSFYLVASTRRSWP